MDRSDRAPYDRVVCTAFPGRDRIFVFERVVDEKGYTYIGMQSILIHWYNIAPDSFISLHCVPTSCIKHGLGNLHLPVDHLNVGGSYLSCWLYTI